MRRLGNQRPFISITGYIAAVATAEAIFLIIGSIIFATTYTRHSLLWIGYILLTLLSVGILGFPIVLIIIFPFTIIAIWIFYQTLKTGPLVFLILGMFMTAMAVIVLLSLIHLTSGLHLALRDILVLAAVTILAGAAGGFVYNKIERSAENV